MGWADHRLTDYAAIECWWEVVFSAYLMVSLQTVTSMLPHNTAENVVDADLDAAEIRSWAVGLATLHQRIAQH